MTCFDDDAVTDVLDAHAAAPADRDRVEADDLSVGRVIARHWRDVATDGGTER